MDEITVASSLEGAGTDDIPSGQPLIHDDQPAMATHAAEPPSPATNMAANVEARDDTPVSKGKAKKPKMSTMYSPMSAGVNYQIFNPYGGWVSPGSVGPGSSFANASPSLCSYGGWSHLGHTPSSSYELTLW